MKIQIKDEEYLLELSNDELDNDNFVEVKVTDDRETPSGTNSMEIMVPMDELMSAVIAFESLKSRRYPAKKLPPMTKEKNKYYEKL